MANVMGWWYGDPSKGRHLTASALKFALACKAAGHANDLHHGNFMIRHDGHLVVEVERVAGHRPSLCMSTSRTESLPQSFAEPSQPTENEIPLYDSRSAKNCPLRNSAGSAAKSVG